MAEEDEKRTPTRAGGVAPGGSSPGPSTIPAARWALLTSFGLTLRYLRELEERLDRGFTADAYGYAGFADIADVRLRAVVSDQLLRTAHAIADNLLSACLHRERLQTLVGGGRPRPNGTDALGALRTNTEIDIALTGFFGALPSALDCLAGVAIAVARIPKSITKADINDLQPLKPKLHDLGTAAQKSVWTDLATLVQAQQTTPPTDWFPWLMAMRNLMTHRARQERIWLQQTIDQDQPQLVVVTDTSSDVTDNWKFDLHLRRRPALPDMQDFTMPGAPSELWIGEPATDTVAATLMLAGSLIDTVAERLLTIWEAAEAAPHVYPAPGAWTLGPEPGPAFDGMTGALSAFRPSGGAGHEQLDRRQAVVASVIKATRPIAGT